MTTKKCLEKLDGRGLLFADGQSTTPVRYLILIEQKFVDGLPSLKSVTGHLEFASAIEIEYVKLLGVPSVLEMEDGRELRGYLRDSNGTFIGNGPILS